MIKRILLIVLIPTLALAFSVELRWTQNPKTDNVTKYNVYQCMSSVQGHYSTCKPRVGKDLKYTNMSSVKFPSYTTATVKIPNLTGPQKMYITAENAIGESGASNSVFCFDQYGNLTIKLIKE
jgi:hypothetical protein